MEEHQHKTISRRKKNIGLIIVIIVIALVIITGVMASAIFSVSSSVNNVINPKDVAMTCFVSGNSIVVQILKSDKSDELYSLELEMDGYELPAGLSTQIVQHGSGYPIKMIYKDVVAGVYKDVHISISATFMDGSSGIVWTDNVRVT